MCGITGFIDLKRDKSSETLAAIATRMSNALRHRGPDSAGVWVDPETGIALGHRRLAIIDLSPTGHQPMHSASERYVISFNGEIYNFKILKAQLEDIGFVFTGLSDTEVLLAAIENWGLKQALKKINGMFAFALWDRKERILHLSRDRMGKKPLYYGWSGDVLLFGSELKALKAYPDFIPEIDRNALAIYTRHNYIPAPWSIYKNIYKLPAASFISFSLKSSKTPESEKYWDLYDVAKNGSQKPFNIPFTDALNELDILLNTAVSERMISDVPLGSFLSGGIDSSLITAMMQKNSSTPIKTFCIGFEESGYNEGPYAKAISEHLKTNHTEYFVTANEARDTISDLPSIFDEPFADPSQIPTYLVSRLARQHVTVALSGDGGDEAFAGYDRYHRTLKIVKILNCVPKKLRVPLAEILNHAPLFDKKEKIISMLRHDNEDQFYRMIMSYWDNSESLVISGQEKKKNLEMSDIKPFMNRMMYIDMMGYLPDDVLVKVDRASMAASLEVRSPLLDYRIIEFAWQTPLSMKIDANGGKFLLRTLLERYIPKCLFDRPKQGFGIPHGEWLRGPLKDWAENLLNEHRLTSEGFFNSTLIREKWTEHVSYKKDWSYALWAILMFQAWNEYNERR